MSFLQDYKMPGRVVNYSLRTYCWEKRILGVGDREIEMEVKSRISQGCTVSSVLFKLVTYRIIIRELTEGTNRKGGGGDVVIVMK